METKVITIVASKVGEYPRYRVVNGEVKDVKDIPEKVRVFFGFFDAKRFATEFMDFDAPVVLKKFTTDVELPDPEALKNRKPKKDRKPHADAQAPVEEAK